MKRQDPEWKNLYLAATGEGDGLAGWLELNFTREGSLNHETNGHMAWVWMEVLASRRRQGIGKRMLAKAAEIAREKGRSLLVGGSDEADGMAFIEAIGAEVAHRWRESRLRLGEIDWEMVEAWMTEGPTRSPGTTLRFFTNHVDDSILEEYCALAEEVSNQEPRGGLDVGDERFTPEIMKERVDNFTQAGGTLLRAVTQERDGALSGYTVMGYFPEEKTMIHQYGTGVKEEYRGRGLGKWLKAAMLFRVRKEYPHVNVVVTGNATSNAAMLSINRRLGFKLHREGLEAQMRLEKLEAYLGK